MSKFTLAERLRDIADKIEDLPESVDVFVQIYSHRQETQSDLDYALSLASGCGGRLNRGEMYQWVEFNKMHDEPLRLTVFYEPHFVPVFKLHEEVSF